MPLASSVDSALRVDIEMFSRGGLAVLDAIEAVGYNTLEHRPSIPKSKQLRLLVRALAFQRCFRSRSLLRLCLLSFPCRPGGWRLWRVAVSSRAVENIAESPAGAVARSYAECRRVARAAASNFYYAFFMLPQGQARRLARLYAFMRLVDDVSD